MPSNFQMRCVAARELIAVPEFPLLAIRRAAERRPRPVVPKRRSRLVAALLAGVSIVAVAAAAEIWSNTHIALTPSGGISLAWNKNSGGTPLISHPTSAQIAAAVHGLNFTAELPTGLPGNAAPISMLANRSLMMLQYNLPGASRRSNHLLTIVIANPNAFTAPFKREHGKYEEVTLFNGTAAGAAVHWRIGNEEVIVPHSTITPAELAHLKNAMLAEAGTR